MIYKLTVTDEFYLDPYGVNTTPKEVVHVEEFPEYGSMVQWARNWYKTQGADRKPRPIKLPNKKRVRFFQPKEYVSVEYKFDINIYGTADFSKYTRQFFLEGYNKVYNYYAEENVRWQEWYQRDFFDLKYGIEVVELYSNKTGALRIRTLFIKLET